MKMIMMMMIIIIIFWLDDHAQSTSRRGSGETKEYITIVTLFPFPEPHLEVLGT